MPPTDPFEMFSPGLTSPGSFARAVTPSDDDDLTEVPRAIYVRGDGSLCVTMKGGGDPVTFEALAGVPLPLRVTRVWATGTTATGIVALW